MVTIRYVTAQDSVFWFRLDRHLSPEEWQKKVRDRMGYVLLAEDRPVGLLRYQLFWDAIPFCTMLYIEEDCQRRGYGRQLMAHWEQDMRTQGYGMVMTSTRADETAQHFYRQLGYVDAGGLLIQIPPYQQPTELFFVKDLGLPFLNGCPMV